LPDKRQALAAIGLYLLVNAIVSGAYVFWRRRATQSGRSLA
jgi:hypothetical protein